MYKKKDVKEKDAVSNDSGSFVGKGKTPFVGGKDAEKGVM
jgi:hypothetical protein